MKKTKFARPLNGVRANWRIVPLALVIALLAVSLPATPVGAQLAAKVHHLTEGQRILHVLSRLGFGARPGDVERVRRIGVKRYVEQQLFPEKIADAAAEAKARELPALWMTTAELYAKYPQPGMLLRRLQRSGELPADLAALRPTNGQPRNAPPPAAAGQMPGPEASGAEMLGPDAAAKNTEKNEAAGNNDGDRRQYREAIRRYYEENNLLPAQRLTADLQASRIMRAVYSERQLQEALVDFWTNHFNVFNGKGVDRWLLVSYDRDTIRPHTLGKFRDLLKATAQSPAMLFYLDNFQSVSPNARPQRAMRQGGLFGGGNNNNNPRRLNRQGMRGRGVMMSRGDSNDGQEVGEQMQRPPQQQAPPQRRQRGINENYARELMELHTLGVEGGYTQKDVQEVARCFTGWTIFDPRGYGGAAGLTAPERAGTFYFNPRQHDDGEKTVLGHKIPAGGGINDGLSVLDILSRHPSTAKFIAMKLARRFVTDQPTPALVEHVAAAYTKSDGDIRETLRAVFTSPEFNAPENYRAKIKTPFELAASAVRTLGGETNGGPALHQWIAKMGEPLYGYQPPTGYPDVAEHWVNTGALLERLNFALALASNRIPGTRVELAPHAGGASGDKAKLIEQFAAVILQGDISPKTKESLLRQLNAPPAAQGNAEGSSAPTAGGGPDREVLMAMDRRERRAARREMAATNQTPVNNEAAHIAALILGSPEFQRQ
ncbi:MAG: DUF1800 domain-containing protein [Pyrinomonadaceae bacterium]